MVKIIELSDKAYYDLVEHIAFTYYEMSTLLNDFDKYVKDSENITKVDDKTLNDVNKLRKRVSKLEPIIDELRNGVAKKENV